MPKLLDEPGLQNFRFKYSRKVEVDIVDELNSLYLQMLQRGMLIVRQAIDEKDDEWAAAEVELLHNLPALINDFDPEQHKYFWNATRAAHVEWIKSHEHAAAHSRMKIYYEPIWKQMEPRIAALSNQVA